jgi:hypothetical protein
MKNRSPYATRTHVIQRVEARLRSESFPRLQMMLLVALTGGFGLLASFSLLRLGLESMAVRYPLALALAYLFFLLLIWLWLRTNAEDYVDVPDPSGLIPRGGTSAGPGDFASGGGGDFGGGGASASFDAPLAELGGAVDSPAKSVGEAVGAAGDADELAIPLVVIALAVGLALASLYVVYIAPALFAEVLVDGALSYALFRRLRAEDRPSWLASAVRNTIVPFAATAVFVAAGGAGMSFYAPGAKSVGQVIERAGAGTNAH